MYDTDWLLQPKPPTKSNILHTYEHAVFHSAIHARIKALAQSRGWLAGEIDYREGALLFSAREESFFGDRLILVDFEQIPKPALAVQLFELILAGTPNHFYLYGRPGDLAKHALWPNLIKICTNLEEPELSPQSLNSILSYHAQQTYPALTELINRPVFEQSLKNWLADTDLTLPTFLSTLDIILLTTITDHTFDLHAFRTLVGTLAPPDYYRWHRTLAELLLKADTLAFLRTIDTALHVEQTDPRALVTLFYKAYFDLLLVSDQLNPQTRPIDWSEFRWSRLRSYKSIPLADLIRWSILYASHEPLLNTGSTHEWATLLSKFAPT